MTGRRGRAPTPLPPAYEQVLAHYVELLGKASLAFGTQRKYASWVRCYLAWLTTVGGDQRDRDRAVHAYRISLKAQGRSPATVNNGLAALADFYVRTGLGAPRERSEVLPIRSPVGLTAAQARRYLDAVAAHPFARDRAIALLPYYAGLRIGEVVALDRDDVRLSTAELGVESGRVVPICTELCVELAAWLDVRPDVPTAAVFLNRRGGRITDRRARAIITELGVRAALTDMAEPFGPHVLRHTYASRLVREGMPLPAVADLLGHARLETTRLYA